MDLAQRMIRLSGYQVGVDIPIEITGIRPGEKLDEELCEPDEQVLSTSHPYINRLAPVPVPQEELSLRLSRLEDAAVRRNGDDVRALLFNAVSASADDQTELSAANVTAAEASVIGPMSLTQNGLPPVITAPA
jgi:FlaA1/EpsC-like NDP-sugar epimerase